jgi:hypothetical protein
MSLCEHFTSGSYPFDVVLVLDDHLGPAEMLVQCRTCRAAYLMEMLDWLEPERLFRISAAEPHAVATLLKDLDRGSCDLNRAAAEARQFSLSSVRLPNLVLLDTQARTLLQCVDRSVGEIPGTAWRELPCDGNLVREIQSARL